MASSRLHAVLLLALTAACDGGTISDRLVDEIPQIDACQANPVALSDPAPLRRLSQAELGNSLRDLAAQLGVTTFDAGPSPFPDPSVGDYFSNNARQNTISLLTANQLMDAAERASEQLTADMVGLLGCAAGTTGCIEGFVRRYAALAYQRPVTTEEVATFVAAYDAVTAVDDVRAGVRAIIELGIQSPDFVYITADAVDEDGRLRFTGHSVARRLSYFLWGSLPDEQLRLAADADALRTSEQLRAQAERMLQDPRAKETLRRFHHEWLAVLEPTSLQKSAEVFPDFTTELAEDLRTELEAFIDRTIWDEEGGVGALLTSRAALVNSRLSAFYGVASGSTGPDDWREVTLGEERRGILTRGAYLASTASATGTSPVRRGVAILSKLMCTSLVAPDDVDTSLPTPAPGEEPKSKKEIFSAHKENAICASCHTQIDPLGFAFEMYDATGAYATSYADGQPIETAGELSDGRSFANATDLVDQLATDTDVARCYSRRWLEWSVGRSSTSAEKCAIASIATTATTSIREAIIELAASDLMIYATEPQP